MNDNLGSLFAQARERGLVDLYTLDGGTYSWTIFLTLDYKEVKAKSGFGHRTPAAAIEAAIRAGAEERRLQLARQSRIVLPETDLGSNRQGQRGRAQPVVYSGLVEMCPAAGACSAAQHGRG